VTTPFENTAGADLLIVDDGDNINIVSVGSSDLGGGLQVGTTTLYTANHSNYSFIARGGDAPIRAYFSGGPPTGAGVAEVSALIAELA
jgi:hypothetical protein